MKKLRVLVLMHQHLLPPESLDDVSDEEYWLKEMEISVLKTLRELGHEVRALGLQEELKPIRDHVEEWKPHIAFNMLTYFHDVATYEANVVSYLELLKLPYTGCNPRGIVLSGDKALSKKILTYHRIRCPQFAVFPRRSRSPRLPSRMQFPVIVKSVVEHGSTGIAQASVVHDQDSLAERVAFIHRTLWTDAIAEQFIPGREMTIAVFGNERLQTMPVWELWFENLPERSEAIATARVKWDPHYAERIGATIGPARDLTPEQLLAIEKIGKRTFRALEMSGYARVDLRVDAEGRVWVIEANCNADLTPGEEVASAAEHAGISYPQLIQRVLNLGLAYQPAWKTE